MSPDCTQPALANTQCSEQALRNNHCLVVIMFAYLLFCNVALVLLTGCAGAMHSSRDMAVALRAVQGFWLEWLIPVLMIVLASTISLVYPEA